MEFLNALLIFLLAAIIAVPVFKYFGFGAVLGYLCAGIVIGPYGLNLIHDVEHILHFSELGVVLLLFIIGLELQPSRLWALRQAIFVWGSVQMLLSAILLGLLVKFFLGLSLIISMIVGFTLSLSSTAFALQMLAERGELTHRFGRSAFTILLFQDIAVVPLLALIPLMGAGSEGGTGGLTGLPLLKVWEL